MKISQKGALFAPFFYKVLSQEILEAEDFLSHNMFLLKLPDFYINVNPLFMVNRKLPKLL